MKCVVVVGLLDPFKDTYEMMDQVFSPLLSDVNRINMKGLCARCPWRQFLPSHITRRAIDDKPVPVAQPTLVAVDAPAAAAPAPAADAATLAAKAAEVRAQLNRLQLQQAAQQAVAR